MAQWERDLYRVLLRMKQNILVLARCLLVFLIFISSSVRIAWPVDLTSLNDAVSWWKADGTGNDYQGTNNGTLQGTATYNTSGRMGQSFLFDGDSDFSLVPDSASLDITANLSISVWVKPHVLNQTGAKGGAGIVSKYHGVTGGRAYAITWEYPTTNGADIAFILSNTGSAGNVCYGDANLTALNVWYHIAGTYQSSSNTVRLWVNGAELTIASCAMSGTIYSSGESLTIGLYRYQDTAPIPYFDGEIDEAAIYSRILTDQEILELSNSTRNTTIPFEAEAGDPATITIVSPSNGTNVTKSTQWVYVNISTSVAANCSWNTSDGDYDSMTPFSISNGTVHFSNFSVVENTVYTVYERCKTYENVENPVSAVHTFGVDSRNQPTINATFDSGNLSSWVVISETEINITPNIDASGNDGETMWVNFLCRNCSGNTTIRLKDPSNQPLSYWAADTYIVAACNGSDDTNWTRIAPASHNSTTNISIYYHVFDCPNNITQVATLFPYPFARHNDFMLNFVNTSVYGNVTNNMTSDDDRPLYFATVTNFSSNNTNKRKIFITSRHHASEVTGEFITEGMMRFLLNSSDANASLLRQNFIFFFMPMVNVDGVYRGLTRGKPSGEDLNREYDEASPEPEAKSVIEWISYVEQTYGRIDAFADMHGLNGATGTEKIYLSTTGAAVYSNMTNLINNASVLTTTGTATNFVTPGTAMWYVNGTYDIPAITPEPEQQNAPTRTIESFFQEGKNWTFVFDNWLGNPRQEGGGASTCDCPAGAGWSISDGSNCSLSSSCSLGAGRLEILSGSLSIRSGVSLRAAGCYKASNQKLYIEEGGILYCS